MAAGHRTTNRAKAKARRARDRRRNHQNRPPASAWLGVGALTLGIGAAVASGSAVAYAAPSTGDSGSAASSGAATTGTGSQTGGPSVETAPTQSPSTATTAGASTSTTTSSPASTKVSAATATTTPPIKHVATRPIKHFAAALSSASKATTPTGFTGQTGAAGAIGSPPHAGPAAQTPLHSAALTASVLKTAAAPLSTAGTTASATPAVSTASVTAAVTPAAVKVNPLEPILNFAMALFGVNPNVAPNPANPIQAFLYAVFTRLDDSVDPAPPAGTPIVGTADPNSGTVTGTAVFATDPGGDVTFTAPATTTGGGAVSVNATTGAFTYTPTTGQRLTATSTTTDTFTVTAHDGLSTRTETVTVPVDAGTPVALIPTVGTPDPSTGVVVGNAVFTDPAGRTLTYSADTTSAGGGAVTIDPTTGAFTYTPTPAQRFGGTLNTDIFTVTASNGVHATAETVTVPINNFSNANQETDSFTLVNLSSQPLIYYALYNGDNNSIQDQPAPGSIVQPGQTQHFSVNYYFLAGSTVTATYWNTDFTRSYQATFSNDSVDDISASCEASSGSCSHTNNTVYLQDAPGTTVTVPATDPTGQAQVLQNLCNGNPNASCSFTATSPPVETLGLKHPVGAAVDNPTDLTGVTTTITVSDAQAVANSIQLSIKASAKVFDLVSLELSTTYQQTVTDTHTFTQAVTVPIPPHFSSQIFAQQPVLSVTGDFTIYMGNTTFTVQGVTFEYPDPGGQSHYTIGSTPITAAAQEPSQENVADTVTTSA